MSGNEISMNTSSTSISPAIGRVAPPVPVKPRPPEILEMSSDKRASISSRYSKPIRPDRPESAIGLLKPMLVRSPSMVPPNTVCSVSPVTIPTPAINAAASSVTAVEPSALRVKMFHGSQPPLVSRQTGLSNVPVTYNACCTRLKFKSF